MKPKPCPWCDGEVAFFECAGGWRVECPHCKRRGPFAPRKTYAYWKWWAICGGWNKESKP